MHGRTGNAMLRWRRFKCGTATATTAGGGGITQGVDGGAEVSEWHHLGRGTASARFRGIVVLEERSGHVRIASAGGDDPIDAVVETGCSVDSLEEGPPAADGGVVLRGILRGRCCCCCCCRWRQRNQTAYAPIELHLDLRGSIILRSNVPILPYRLRNLTQRHIIRTLVICGTVSHRTMSACESIDIVPTTIR